MHSVFVKTFGGLSSQYYLRQLFFGLLFGVSSFYLFLHNTPPGPLADLVFVGGIVILNTLLYPYSRFVYEGIVRFIMGDSIFVVNAILMVLTKLIMMGICWAGALIIAPFGLAYLFFYHSRAEGRQ